jgi:competence/damage-inducible protein CinA-like protein
MKPIAEIFSQGEEVVCGQTVDSNAAWLSQQLNAQGLAVKRHTAVGDKLDDLVALLLEIAQRADCCICTGGLGPTIDDLTAAAVSQAFDLPLVLDETALAQIEQYYANRQRSMPAVNRKQALLPQGARRIDNPRGTAPGFSLRSQRCWFVFLPGVPSEMMAMFSATVLAQLPQQFCLQADIPISLRSIGIGESAIQQALHDWQPPEGVQLGFRATADEVQTKLVFAPFITAEQRLAISHAVADRIGDYVFAIDGVSAIQGSLLAVVDQYLQQQQLTVAVLETASHGLLTAKCLGMAGLVAS